MTNSEKHLKTVGGILSKRGKLSASEPVGCNWVGDTQVMQAQGFALFWWLQQPHRKLGNIMEHYGTLWSIMEHGTLRNIMEHCDDGKPFC